MIVTTDIPFSINQHKMIGMYKGRVQAVSVYQTKL